ncbi:MAG: 50S ribosomal protein L9 [Clostridiales bacterium]|nr:50S ribosomal protein L9 [Clostridiales bacterium]
MKVLLTADVAGHGKKGELVEVNDSYARNYLLPRKLAKEATKAVLNEYAQMKEREARIAQKEKEEAMELHKKLNGKTFTVAVRYGEGKMYGSVTAQDIAGALAAGGLVVDKKKIIIKEPIKTLGLHDIEIKVYKETVAKVKVSVEPSEVK